MWLRYGFQIVREYRLCLPNENIGSRHHQLRICSHRHTGRHVKNLHAQPVWLMILTLNVDSQDNCELDLKMTKTIFLYNPSHQRWHTLFLSVIKKIISLSLVQSLAGKMAWICLLGNLNKKVEMVKLRWNHAVQAHASTKLKSCWHETQIEAVHSGDIDHVKRQTLIKLEFGETLN
jgi:hypothetical protein